MAAASHTFDPESSASEPQVSGWALGGIGFAASLLTLVGGFQVIAGLAAIIDDEFFVATRNYAFDLDVSTWGWIHLGFGVLLLATGVGLFGRRAWAGVTALFLAILSAFLNFFFIPFYPFWAIVVIALDVWIIWSLTRPSAIRT
jgi:hypothetical protein